MTIGTRLIQLRSAHVPKRLTQDQVADICGVTKSSVSQWESDATVPHLTNLLKLRERVRFSLDWLLTGEGEMGEVCENNPLINQVVNAMRLMGDEDAKTMAAISSTFPRGKRFNVEGSTSMEFKNHRDNGKKKSDEGPI